MKQNGPDSAAVRQIGGYMARKHTVVGLDIGSHAAKAAWGEQRGRSVVITRVESLRLPAGKENLDSVIQPWIEKLGIRRHPCVLGISAADTIFQPLFLAPEDPRSPEQAAVMEVLRFKEMASDPMIFAHSQININPGERRLLLAMARAAIIERALERARGWELEMLNVVPTPAALFEAAIATEEAAPPQQPAVYANIGASGTEIAIGSRDTGLLFARAFGAGGQMFTDAVSRSEQIPAVQAENRKLSEGAIGADSPLSSALAQVADTWIRELQSCLAVYRSLFPDRRAQPSRVLLTGGGAELRGMAERVSAALQLPASLLPPLPGLSTTPRYGSFSAAAGLAIAGIRAESGSPVMSLLPEETRVELIFRRQKPYWISAGIAALLILAVSLAAGYLDFKRMEKHLRDQDEKLRRRQALMAEIDSIRAKNEIIAEMARPVRSVIDRAPAICEIISMAAGAASQQESFFLVADAETYFSQAPAQPSGPVPGMRERRRAVQRPSEVLTSTSGIDRVIIEGYTRNTSLASVKNLITRLSEADFIQSADLLTDDRMAPPPVPVADHMLSQRFALDIRLKSP